MPVNLTAPANSGIERFFGALGNGDAIASRAQADAQYRLNQADALEADLDRKITQAVLERDKRKAQQAYAQSFIDTGMDPTQAAAHQNFAIGGLASNLGDVQKYDMTRRAEQALVAGGKVDPANAILAALKGDPLQHTTVDGDMVIANRYGDAVLDTTPIAEARIRAQDAMAADRYASANLDNVKAGAGGFAPRAGGQGGGIQAVPTAGGVDYVDTGNNATARARKILEDAIAGGGAVNGYSVGSIKRDMADDGHARVDTQVGPGQMRWITGLGQPRDIPLGAPPAAVDAPPPPPAAQAAAALQPANAVLAQAQQAIAAGADPAKVRARLIQLGHPDLAAQL